MKKVICLIMAVVLSLSLIIGLSGCGKAEPFNCDGCGRTITEGKKHTVSAYGEKLNYCDDCYEQLQGIKEAMGQ